VLVPFCTVVVLFLLWKKLPREAFFFSVCTLGAGLVNLLAKLFFGRARPDLWASIAPESDYSFPSGHAMASMAVAAALVLMLWPTRFRWLTVALGLIYVLAIGLTRLYLGVHYPTDILGGWCASLAWVGGVYAIINARRQWKTRAERQKIIVNS
jgi:membrane-associated phospholipid phosphatase